jgi:hypothetical protein
LSTATRFRWRLRRGTLLRRWFIFRDGVLKMLCIPGRPAQAGPNKKQPYPEEIHVESLYRGHQAQARRA